MTGRHITAAVALDVRRILRNPRYLVFAIGMPLGFYLLYSAQFGGAARPFAGTTWGAYFLISMVVFGGAGTTLNVTGTQTAAERDQGWHRLLRVTPLSAGQYVAAKVITAMLMSLVVSVAIPAAAALNGVAVAPLGVLEAAAAVWAGSLVFATIGLALGQWLDGTSVTYGVTLVYLGTAFLGGLWTPVQVLPRVFTSIAEFMPSYRVAQLGWDLLAHRAPPPADLAILAAYAVVFGVVGGVLYARIEPRRP